MIRIGIIGCGRILAAHLRGYRRLREAGVDDFQITALCSRKESDAWMYVRRGEGPPQRPPCSDIPGDPLAISDEYLSDFQDTAEVQVFTDFRKLIAEAPIDAIHDLTLHSLHHEIALDAFRRGKDVLSQKPLAVSVAAGRQMLKEAEDRKRVFGVFENFRNTAMTRHLKWLFGSGRIGDPQMILAGYVGVWWAPNRIVANTPWRHRRIEAGGITLDMGVHFFDQFRFLMGEPVSVMGSSTMLEPQRVTLDKCGAEIERIDCDADDTFTAHVEFANGKFANLVASWAGHGAPSLMDKGTIYYGSRGCVSGGDVIFDDGSKTPLAELFEKEADAATKERYFPMGITDSFALNQHDWLEAIWNRRQPETSGLEGLRNLAGAFAILESSHAGRRVLVKDVLRGTVREYQRPIDQHFGLDAEPSHREAPETPTGSAT